MTMTTTQNGTNGAHLARRNDLKSFLDAPAVRAKLAEAAGRAMKPEDLIRLALVAASRTPDLKKCSNESILRSLLDAAALGIKPGGLMGRGYLVPRKNNKNNTVECNFDPGWRGLIDIARRSGQIRRIEAHVVYQKDEFHFERNPLTTLRHVPTDDEDPGPVTRAYAVAEFTGGEVQIEIVPKRDLDKIRKLGAGGGPWSSWYDEMARKTAVRRLCKYLPYDPQLDAAIEASDRSDGFDGGVVEVVEEKPGRKPRRSLAEKLSAAEGEATLPATEDESEVDAADADPETGELPHVREPGEEG